MNIKNRCVPCGKVEGWLERIIAIEEQGIALNNEVNNIWDSLGLQGTIVECLRLEVDAIKSDYQAKINQEVKTTSTPTFAGIITPGLVDGVDISAFKSDYDLIKSDYESLKSDYQAKINQAVKTTSTPTFAGIITPGLVDGVDISAFKAEYDLFSSSIQDIIIGQFNLDLLAINVDKNWNNKSITNINNIELNGLVDGVDLSSFKADYDSKINQGVKTTHSPTFAGITVSGNISISGLVDGVDLSSFKSDYDSKINQELKSTSEPSFYRLNLLGNSNQIKSDDSVMITNLLGNAYQELKARSFYANGVLAIDNYNDHTSRYLTIKGTGNQIRCNNRIQFMLEDLSARTNIDIGSLWINGSQIIDSSRNLVNIGNITVSGICTGLAVRGVTDLNVTASANYRNKHDAEIFWNNPYTTSPGTMYYEKKKTIKFPAGLGPGTYRVYYESKVETSHIFCHSRIYKNGIALGTEHSTYSDSYVTFTEDFTGPLEPGSTIELWAYKRGVEDYYLEKAYLRNFRIGYDLSMPTAMPSNNS